MRFDAMIHKFGSRLHFWTIFGPNSRLPRCNSTMSKPAENAITDQEIEDEEPDDW